MHYSLPGYKIAVMRRSARTLLVEGADDQKILHRLLMSRDDGTLGVDSRPVVDHAHLIQDSSLKGIGNRTKVIQVSRDFDRGAEKFVALIDREWDGFDQLCLDFAPEFGPNEQLLRKTRGHSVENYFFDSEFFIDYLLQHYAEHATHQLRHAVVDSFSEIVWLATKVSLAAREASILGVICSVLSDEVILGVDKGYGVNSDAIAKSLEKKGVDAARVEAFTGAASKYEKMACPESWGGRWIVHGHVGAMIIWCCIGFIAYRFGASRSMAHEIAVGHVEQKRRAFAHFLAASAAHEKTPLDRIADWAFCR